jgi:hypothetical protein
MMPAILCYFFGGLLASLLAGVIAYYFVGHASAPLLAALFGNDAGRMWGRLYRMTLVTVALTGGLSVKFYGCSGPTDYQDVAQSHPAMYALASAQAGQSMSYLLTFVLITAAVAAWAFAWLRRSSSQRS